ncbi:uncharacterized protein [Manis javanica]|uniref:uncharacterized protein isoform X2 n=1 Tax=Manis javanica TaxID=9974 RepID=UPI003C6CF8BA
MHFNKKKGKDQERQRKRKKGEHGQHHELCMAGVGWDCTVRQVATHLRVCTLGGNYVWFTGSMSVSSVHLFLLMSLIRPGSCLPFPDTLLYYLQGKKRQHDSGPNTGGLELVPDFAAYHLCIWGKPCSYCQLQFPHLASWKQSSALSPRTRTRITENTVSLSTGPAFD